MPLFGHFYSKISSTLSAFMDQSTLKDKQVSIYIEYKDIRTIICKL